MPGDRSGPETASKGCRQLSTDRSQPTQRINHGDKTLAKPVPPHKKEFSGLKPLENNNRKTVQPKPLAEKISARSHIRNLVANKMKKVFHLLSNQVARQDRTWTWLCDNTTADKKYHWTVGTPHSGKEAKDRVRRRTTKPYHRTGHSSSPIDKMNNSNSNSDEGDENPDNDPQDNGPHEDTKNSHDPNKTIGVKENNDESHVDENEDAKHREDPVDNDKLKENVVKGPNNYTFLRQGNETRHGTSYEEALDIAKEGGHDPEHLKAPQRRSDKAQKNNLQGRDDLPVQTKDDLTQRIEERRQVNSGPLIKYRNITVGERSRTAWTKNGLATPALDTVRERSREQLDARASKNER